MASSSSADAGPAKRPARTRRAATGVVGCDIDMMILEAQKWKDTDRLVEDDMPFMLTTNSSYAESSTDHGRVVNNVVNERYFSRPEVIRAYRQQIIIQTPAFVDLSGQPEAGSRTRVKTMDQGMVDSGTDQVYERRHRKYEGFEKRTRLREKEKLQYEHYKLKERIEQLRSMDGAAFLVLDPSYFSSVPKESEGTELHNGMYSNGATASNEAERRRDEILETAAILDERYRSLLPPDRVTKKIARAPEPSAAPEAESLPEEPPTPALLKEAGKLKLAKASSTSTTSTRSPSYVQPGSAPPASKKPRLIAPVPAAAKETPQAAKVRKQAVYPSAVGAPPLPLPSPVPHTARPVAPYTHLLYQSPLNDEHRDEPTNNRERISDVRTLLSAPTSPRTASPPPLPPVNPDSAPLDIVGILAPNYPFPPTPPLAPDLTLAASPYPLQDKNESISVNRPTKRYKKSKAGRKSVSRANSVPNIEAIPSNFLPSNFSHAESPTPSGTVLTTRRRGGPKGPVKHREPVCYIRQAALHNVSTRDKAPRHVMAFGVKLPDVVIGTKFVEFETPAWTSERPSMLGLEPDGSDESEEEEEIDELEPSQQPEERRGEHGEQGQEQPSDLPRTPIENGTAKSEGLSSRPLTPVGSPPQWYSDYKNLQSHVDPMDA